MRTSAAFFLSRDRNEAFTVFLGRICSPGLLACCLSAVSSLSLPLWATPQFRILVLLSSIWWWRSKVVLLQLLRLVQVGELDVKINGKFVPVHAVKADSGNGGVAHSFLTSAIDGEWPASCTRHFTFREHRCPLTRLGRPQSQWGHFGTKKNLMLLPDSSPRYWMWQWCSLTLVLMDTVDTVTESGFYTCKSM